MKNKNVLRDLLLAGDPATVDRVLAFIDYLLQRLEDLTHLEPIEEFEIGHYDGNPGIGEEPELSASDEGRVGGSGVGGRERSDDPGRSGSV